MKPTQLTIIITFLFFSSSLLFNFGFAQKGVQVYTNPQKGIEFVAKDSLFSTQFQFRMQNRIGYESTSMSDLTPESFEFRIRRLRMRLKGFVFNPKWTYHIQLSFSRGDMDWESTKPSNSNTSVNIIRDAVITYQMTKAFSITMGQTKLPGNRQRVVSSGDQQFVDRSIVNSTFTLDRDCGIFLTYEQNYFRLKGAITTGEGRNVLKSNKGLSYTGRVEILPFGKFTGNNDYVEGDLSREQKPKISIAATYNYNALAIRSGGQLGNDLYEAVNMQNLQVDFLFKYKGFAFYNEFCERIADKPVTVDATGLKTSAVYVGFGNLTQASYLFKNNYEIAARYAFVSPFRAVYANENFPTINLNREEHVHLGITKYIVGHRLKVQFNLTYNTKRNIQLVTSSSKLGGYFQIELGI